MTDIVQAEDTGLSLIHLSEITIEVLMLIGAAFTSAGGGHSCKPGFGIEINRDTVMDFNGYIWSTAIKTKEVNGRILVGVLLVKEHKTGRERQKTLWMPLDSLAKLDVHLWGVE